MTAFSRLQLAAALLEYDNDPNQPTSMRSAQESAIFSHIRTRNAPRARTVSGFEHLRETQNLLGVDLPPSETGSVRGSIDARRSLAGTRNSRGSIDVLRNPFGDDMPESEQGAEDEESEGEDFEVDLEAWGMADFLGKEKEKPRSKNQRSGPRVRQPSKAQSEMLPNTHSIHIDEFGQLDVPPAERRRQTGARSKSIGGFGAGEEFLDAMRRGPIASEADFRRRSIGAPLDSAGRKTPDFERPISAAGFRHPPPNRSSLQDHQLGPSQTIPFPSSSPVPEEDTRSIVLDENPFALPPPSPTRTSRFDPKAAQPRPASRASLASRPMLDPIARERTTSLATVGTQGYLDDNPFSLPPPSPTRTSRFDPKAAAHTRTLSNASLGSRIPIEGDRISIASGQLLDQDPRQSQRYSRIELMRPKVLIMPSPLQGSDQGPPAPELPPGFEMSIVGPPLPPGAKSGGRPVSRLIGGLQVPTASNAFTPNPRLSMSLSQLTFRNSLMVGGQRDVAYEDIESGLRRAGEDGEQIYQEENIEDEVAEEQKQAQGRAPGKLYGRSLMDELEARKEKMRSKQRVFTGDQRPLMMSRGQIRRSSTLIDPATLQDRPASQTFSDRPPLTRRGSSGSKPLLDFSGEGPVSPGTGPGNGRIPNSKSVFGVDQLWERELAKLKEIEAAEKEEEEAQQRKEEEKAAKKAKNKGKAGVQPPSPPVADAIPRPSLVSDLPPTLPVIEKATTRRTRPPVLPELDSDSDSEASENEAKAKAAAHHGSEADGWESSDDEGRRKMARKPGSDSEDDVPLARQLPLIRAPSPDSEDEKPLAKVLERKSMLDIDFDDVLGGSGPSKNVSPSGDDEDNTPLAVRHPRAQSIVAHSIAHDDEDDDEKPLGLKQTQQQQQQVQLSMMAQQQQMMMQAQLRNTMAFGAPSMLSGFSPFLMTTPTFGAAPAAPLHDPAKYQSVDQWRHNVAAE